MRGIFLKAVIILACLGGIFLITVIVIDNKADEGPSMEQQMQFLKDHGAYDDFMETFYPDSIYKKQ